MRLIIALERYIVTHHLALPTALFVLNLGCAVESFFCGDWKKAVYFAASSLCIAMVSI